MSCGTMTALKATAGDGARRQVAEIAPKWRRFEQGQAKSDYFKLVLGLPEGLFSLVESERTRVRIPVHIVSKCI